MFIARKITQPKRIYHTTSRLTSKHYLTALANNQSKKSKQEKGLATVNPKFLVNSVTNYKLTKLFKFENWR